MALQAREIHFDSRREANQDGVIAPVDVSDLFARRENAFREQKAGRKLRIMPRRPHSDGNGLIAEPDFERFFDG